MMEWVGVILVGNYSRLCSESLLKGRHSLTPLCQYVGVWCGSVMIWWCLQCMWYEYDTCSYTLHTYLLDLTLSNVQPLLFVQS